MTNTLTKHKPLKGINNLVFKELFTSIDTREYASSIISYLTEIDYGYILDNFTLSTSELPSENKDESRRITDIVLKIGNNIINMEANNNYYPGLEERNEVYLSTLVARTPKRRQNYDKLPKFYQINFDNFIRYNNDILRGKMYDEVVKEKINSKSEIIHVSLEKIRKRCYDNDEIKGNISFEDKLFLMLVANPDELKEIAKGNGILEKVRKKIMFLNEECDFNRIGEYDWEEEQERIRITIEETAREKGMKDGMKEGMKEGRKEGRKEGIKEGRKEGRKEGELAKGRAVAKNMLKDKVNLAVISKYTGLSLKEIKSLN